MPIATTIATLTPSQCLPGALPTGPWFMPDCAWRPADRLASDAAELARRAVIEDIESEGIRLDEDGTIWWDTRPMGDPREHSPEVIDMFAEVLRYGVASGLLSLHPQRPYLVHIHNRG